MKQAEKQSGVFCLNSGWKFIEKDYGVLPEGKTHEEVYGFSKGGAARGPAGAGFDDREWETVDLPHDFVTRKDFTPDGSPNQGYKERGIVWYRMSFILPYEDREKQLLLEFEGMSCDAEIYVNGTILKRNFSGYQGFVVDMTDMVNFGMVPNVIAIKIDASAWEGWWYEGAGIYRNVWLTKKYPVHIAYEGIFAKPVKREDSWSLEIEVETENSFKQEREIKVKAQLFDAEKQKLAEIEQTQSVPGYETTTSQMTIDGIFPKLWSPEVPACYEVKVSVWEDGTQRDYLYQTVGFREIDLKANTGFWLNGENRKLKGFCNHQDHAGIGVAVPHSIKEYRLLKLKELGADSYRCAHNPDPETLEICDRIGLMVMEENRTFSSAADNLRRVQDMVRNARNHPCVIFYSAFNEEPLQGTEKGKRMAGRIQAAIRSMDDTRPVLGAFNGGYMEENGAAAILDCVGINYNPSRYDEFHKKFPDIPLIGSETASAFMVRGEYQTDMREHVIDGYDEHCAAWGNTIQEAWKYVAQRDFVAGAFVWTGFDYRGEPTPFEWPSVATFFGTYDSCGFEKDACYFYKAFWKEEPTVHIISPWTKSRAGDMVKVMVITNCDSVKVQVGSQLIAEKETGIFNPLILEIPYEEMELSAEGYKNGRMVTKDVQMIPGKERRLLLQASHSSLKTGGFDAVAINVFLTDENGLYVNDDDQKVHFAVENGKILGVGNGNPNSHEADISKERMLFHGNAQAIIKPEGEETIKVTVCADGVKDAVIEIPIIKTENIPYILPVKEMVLDQFKLFHKILEEKPVPDLSLKSNDMNSYEPVSYGNTGQAELENKYGKYGLYMSRFQAGKEAAGRYLYFENILGHVWIYLDGEEIYKRCDEMSGMVTVDIPDKTQGNHILSLVIYNVNEEWPHAGIVSPAVMRMK